MGQPGYNPDGKMPDLFKSPGGSTVDMSKLKDGAGSIWDSLSTGAAKLFHGFGELAKEADTGQKKVAEGAKEITAATPPAKSWLDSLGNSLIELAKKAMVSDAVIGQISLHSGGFGGKGGIVNASFNPGVGGFGANDNLARALGGGAGRISARDMRNINPEMAAYIRQSAIAHGINPDIALRIANTEGLRGSIPGVHNTVGDKGTSFGPFQLHYASRIPGLTLGGLGDAYTRATGHHASDARHWKEQTDFAMEQARKGGWGPWHGRFGAGIGVHDGIGAMPRPVPVVQPPPRQQQMVEHHHHIYVGGKQVAHEVSKQMAKAGRFPGSTGGPDTYGNHHGPATHLTDVA